MLKRSDYKTSEISKSEKKLSFIKLKLYRTRITKISKKNLIRDLFKMYDIKTTNNQSIIHIHYHTHNKALFLNTKTSVVFIIEHTVALIQLNKSDLEKFKHLKCSKMWSELEWVFMRSFKRRKFEFNY